MDNPKLPVTLGSMTMPSESHSGIKPSGPDLDEDSFQPFCDRMSEYTTFSWENKE